MSAIGAVALVRRAMEGVEDDSPDNEQPPFSLAGFLMFWFTAVAFVLISSCIGYIFGKVVTTLSAVEDPNPDVYVRIENDAPVSAQDAGDDDVPPPKPVTSSIKSAVAHLTARAGRRSLFRGIKIYILTALLIDIVIYPASAAFNVIGSILARFFAEVLLSHLRVAWVHIVISEPSNKSLWSRIPTWRKTIVKVAPAAAIRSLASQLVTFIPLLIAQRAGVFKGGAVHASPSTLPAGLGLLALHLVLYVLIQMPAEVTFIRVAASMLPEDDEAIVPFDRSFGGKVTPEIVGGQGKIGIVDAWRSFNWGSRMRFLAVVGKVFLMQTGVGLVFGVILAAELALFFFHR